ncbi:MAG: glycosyltransferase [Bacteroidetes bacterium]|nr:MAG: glycosyltransferase [Bacteroidota bacterium]
MKIISIGPAHPYRGGLASFNDRLAQQFSDEGHNIEIVTFRLQYPRILFPGKTQYTESPAPEGIKITRKLNSINPFNWISTGLRIKKAKPDILLIRFWLPFMGPCLGTVARIAKSNRHTSVISIFDNVVPHEKRPGDKILTKYFTNGINAGIVMSQTVLDDLKTFRKNIPVKLSPHPLFDNYGSVVGREEALKSLKLSSDSSYLLFFGFVRAYKGLDLLIKAFSDKRLRNRNLKLLIAGEFYEDEVPYRKMVKKYNLENDVIFYNYFIKDNEVSLFFSVADLIVQPYKTATQSGVTQIAFYFEKPMLVTDVGGLKEIVKDGKSGYVVKPESRYITEAILDFFENNRRSLFTEGVKQEKDRFSWDKMTASIIEVYNKIYPPTPL